MVSYKNIERFALVSLYNKSKLNLICKYLQKFNIGIISTGSTFNKIKKLGYSCYEVSKFTNFKEILDGRVKTIDANIYASILYKREDPKHLKTFKKLKFPKIDFVFINLYPFEEISKKEKNQENIIEMIDIGGPALIRAASKNFKNVTTICDSNDYSKFFTNIKLNNGTTSLIFRKKMAIKAFKTTYEYDKNIYNWISGFSNKKITLRYGENPNQQAKLIKTNNKSFFDHQLQGKKISYNNILDVNSGLDFLSEFNEPTCVIIKHNNACGIASSINIEKSIIKAISSDENSAFGGVVLVNRKITAKIAEIFLDKFFEILVAPSFDKSSIKKLKNKEKLILINSNGIIKKEKKMTRSIRGGYLIQDLDVKSVTKKIFKIISKNKKLTKTEYDDVLFAFKVVKHLKSNAIVLVKNKQSIGIGAGQMNRFDATKIAINKYKENFKLKNFICASDAFFPFTDSLQTLYKNGCNCIVQPYGSIKDKEIIDFVDQNNIKLLFSKKRVFKH